MKKNIFKSKTAAMALITSLVGIAAVFMPDVNELLTTHSAEVLTALGAVNLVLRAITKGGVSLFPSK